MSRTLTQTCCRHNVSFTCGRKISAIAAGEAALRSAQRLIDPRLPGRGDGAGDEDDEAAGGFAFRDEEEETMGPEGAARIDAEAIRGAIAGRAEAAGWFANFGADVRRDSALPYSALLCSTLLYSTLLYSTLLYSTLLYSTLLYSTLLSILS